MKKVDLSKFANPQYKPGSFLKRSLWFIANTLFIQSAHPFSSVRIMALKCFGAKVGIGCVVRPRVNIKHPWLLSIGNHTWIGENVWIDNLTDVSIGNHVCMSQGATIITGNHRWDKVTFDLTLHPITIQDGAWIGAKATSPAFVKGVIMATPKPLNSFILMRYFLNILLAAKDIVQIQMEVS